MVVGGGIGGLSAAIALRDAGRDVLVLERAPEFGEVGAGIGLMPNALCGLAALGVTPAALGVTPAGFDEHPGYVAGAARTPDGRWLARRPATDGTRTGDARVLGIARPDLLRLLLDRLPSDVLRTGSELAGIEPGPPARVHYRRGGHTIEAEADLVVGADGIRSVVRSLLWPDGARPVYTGSTAWRGVTRDVWPDATTVGFTWGRGAEFGTIPLLDGRVYWYGAVNAAPGERAVDELGAVCARFAHWHQPIPALLAGTDPESVLRNDLEHLAPPLPTYVRGAVALLGDAAHAMTPNLGQGAGQAIEDAVVLGAACAEHFDVGAALAVYDALRRPRSQGIARAALRIGRFGQQVRHPAAVALRNGLLRTVPPGVMLRAMARYGDWHPPRLSRPDGAR